MTSDNGPIFIIDELVSRPGGGEALLETYRLLYFGLARKSGMTLLHSLVEPCMWVKDGPNKLVFIWTVPDAMGVWMQKIGTRSDPHIGDIWREIDSMAASRTRGVLCEADIVANLDARSDIDIFALPADV